MTLRQAIDELNKKPCTCVRCTLCRGTGNVRFFMGDYSPTCCDDLCDLEPCDQCTDGIVEVCERCREMDELHEQAEEEEYRQRAAEFGRLSGLL